MPRPGDKTTFDIVNDAFLRFDNEIRMRTPEEAAADQARRAAERARETTTAAWAVPLGNQIFDPSEETYGWWTLLRRAEVTVFGQAFVVFELADRDGELRLSPLTERLAIIRSRRPA